MKKLDFSFCLAFLCMYSLVLIMIVTMFDQNEKTNDISGQKKINPVKIEHVSLYEKEIK